MTFKNKLEEYTELEFLELISELFSNTKGLKGNAREQYTIRIVKHVEKITEHPERTDLICYPPADREDSPEGILKEVKRWRSENGKPGFKSD